MKKISTSNHKRSNVRPRLALPNWIKALYTVVILVLISFSEKPAYSQICCPEFKLKDAVEICPPEGACIGGDPAGMNTHFAACKEINHRYTVYPNDPIYTYTWTVTGGMPATFTGNPINILWGSGNTGFIQVVITDSIGCSDTITQQICLIDGPEADFTMSGDTVCLNTMVTFYNLSVGGSSFFWDFGDGTTYSGFNPPPASYHSYSVPGTYVVTLTVVANNDTLQGSDVRPCGCIDTISKTIVVLDGEGPVIETDCCYGTVCPGDSSVFCTPTICPTYIWAVTGGTIVSGAGTSCITVVWDATYSVPSTVSLTTPSCSNAPCQGTTTLDVPVLYPNLPISGPTPPVVCQGSSATFSLPTLPGTYYTWTVVPGGTSFNLQDRNTPDVNIIFNNPGTYTVTCNYTNPLAGCSGSSIFTVDVRPVFSISGPGQVCEGSTTSYFANGNAGLWDVLPLGPVVTPTGPFSADLAWGVPGTYVVTGYPQTPASWCNSDAQVIVQVIAKPVLGSITGNTLVCPGKNQTYGITSNTPGSPFIWTITSGTGVIQSEMGADNDSVVVQWTGTGPWQLDVFQEVIINPGDTCASLISTLNINPYLPPILSGPATACVDEITTYTAAGPVPPGGFKWEIFPSNQGSILSGQGSSTITIKWHGTIPNTGTVQVSTCGGSDQLVVAILNPPAIPNISANGPTDYCLPDMPNNLLLSVPAVYASYQWYLNGVPIGTATSNSYLIPNGTFTGAGAYVFTIEVSNGVCSSFASILVLIGDCNGSGGPPPNPISCDIDFTMNPNPACVGQLVTFTPVPIQSGFQYVWDFGDGSFSYQAVTTHAYATASTFSVKLTAILGNICMEDTTKSITINPLPNCFVIPSDTVFCPGDSVLLSSSCPPSFTYQWYKDGSPIAGATSNTYYAQKHGEYWFEVANQFGCFNNSDSVYLYLKKLPAARIEGDGSVCAFPGGTSNFNLSSIYNSNYIYSWSSNPAGAAFSPNGSNLAAWTNVTLTLPGTLPAQYEFIVAVTDIVTGCTNYDTLCVTFYETPVVNVPWQSGCEGTPYTFVPTPNDPSLYDYYWSNGATTPIITVSTAGFYSLTIVDKVNGCSAFTPAGWIYPKPDLSLFPRGCSTIFCNDSLHLYLPLPLNATAWPNTYPAAYPVIDWYDNNNTLLGSGENLYFSSSATGSFQISAAVQNHFGCIDSVGVFCVDVICCEIDIEWVETENASCSETADGSFTIVLNPVSQGSPFTLTQIFPPPVQSWTIVPGIPFTVPNLLPGIYTFTVSDSSGFCIETIEVDIGFEQEDCCFAATDTGFIHIMTPITYTSTTVWDNKYYIHDGVIVTVNGTVLDITNVDVVFGECAGIEFINGGYLRANNSVFRPCNMHKTWKGLRFENPVTSDTVINMINECTFKNAEVALYFRGGSDGLVSNSLFSNCNYGIRVENNNHFNHPVSGNRFVTETFFPDFMIDCRYPFINNLSTYGIHSTSSRFLQQVSHNEFINSIDPAIWPRTYGIHQTTGGGKFTLNSFTDYYNAIWLQNQIFYSGIENNKIESNVKLTGFTAIYINNCKGPIIEVNKNEISNNYNQFVSPWAIYASKSSSVSILDNLVDGYAYGILSISNNRIQISNNELRECQTNGIYILENPGQFSFITCNTVKMKSYSGTTGMYGQSMSALSEISSNCILDCANSMYFGGSSSLALLPRIRNNFLYNYNNTGINVVNHSGNIGTAADHGMNTLWSNRNTAIDINSNSNITVANNFGMFNIAWPFVQITANNPYHSTASCGHQIFNMPSQGNLNVTYTCDNFKKITEPFLGFGGYFYPSQNINEWLSSSASPFVDAGVILANLENAGTEVLNEVVQSAKLSGNEIALLKYDHYFRKADYENARIELNNFNPVGEDEEDFKELREMELNITESGWTGLTGGMISKLQQIIDKGSAHANYAIFILNNSSTYRDYLLEEAFIPEVVMSDQVKRIEPDYSFLNIYPNPATNTVFVEVIFNNTQHGKLEMFDVSGKRVFDFTLNMVAGGFELDIQNLREGFYIITLTDPETGYVQKGKLVKGGRQ
jgi:hypothetical protein